jgi:hypothetical protein
VIVLRTQGAPQRGVFRGRSPRRRESGEVEGVPTSRVTVVQASAFDSPDEADRWLSTLRRDKGALDREAGDAAAVLNRFLRAHRAAAADPWARDVSPEHALVVRVGYVGGREEQLACEELVLRARADLEAGRPREAALQARVALEAVAAELQDEAAGLNAHRAAIAEAANKALQADPDKDLQAAIEDAVKAMEAALRKRRLRQI